MPLDSERQRLLIAIRNEFGVILKWDEHLLTSATAYRSDVTVHWIETDRECVTPVLERDLREWLEERGWQYSRQLVIGEPIEQIYIGRLIEVPIGVGYHVTRRTSLPGIRASGLLPGVPERQTTGAKRRRDCEGNIYICKQLGKPDDHNRPKSRSAHWWRGELARKTESDVADWIILMVRLNGLPYARIIRDIWSESGIIVTNVTNIPCSMLSIAFD